jgi:hypothetical protein
MSLFVIACGVAIAAALLAEQHYPEGVLVVPVGVWLAVLGVLGVWLLMLALAA